MFSYETGYGPYWRTSAAAAGGGGGGGYGHPGWGHGPYWRTSGNMHRPVMKRSAAAAGGGGGGGKDFSIHVLFLLKLMLKLMN
ncbi:hypothetical protein TNCT_573301 [Trichonephila clavata]|uniref:Uncharacterized protein n=1 Tax=Trichonephila clavata TaxID=2740835 RepID=A0A8X6K5Z9_TRICU|nr:hypothetical protein TNCT_573301 [Trichonephila clavata]